MGSESLDLSFRMTSVLVCQEYRVTSVDVQPYRRVCMFCQI